MVEAATFTSFKVSDPSVPVTVKLPTRLALVAVNAASEPVI